MATKSMMRVEVEVHSSRRSRKSILLMFRPVIGGCNNCSGSDPQVILPAKGANPADLIALMNWAA